MDIASSELRRIMAGCDGSIGLGVKAPNLPKSDAEREGMAAHQVFAYALRTNLPASDMIGRELFLEDQSKFIVTKEIIDWLDPHIDYIRNLETETDASGDSERRVDWKIDDNTITARTDRFSMAVVPNRVLHVHDLKFGWRLIDPEMNWQLISYAIGVASFYQYNFDSVVLTIHQPRPYHPDGTIRRWQITAGELLELHRQIVAKVRSLGSTLHTGSHCHRCRAASICPALRESSMSIIDATIELGYDDSLSGAELGFELNVLTAASQLLKTRLDAIQELAQYLIRNGKIVDGYAMKPIVGHRQWKDNVTPEMIAALTGVDITEKKLITPAAAGRAGVPAVILDEFTERPSRGFSLSRDDVNKTAMKLFSTTT